MAFAPATVLQPSVTPEGRVRLDFLDGLRGLAALVIVVYHAMHFTGEGFILSDHAAVRMLQYPFRYGFLAVPVFIVLSGYCLGLPVVRNGLWFKGGMGRYIRRRSRRILPTYYAALALSLIMIVLIPLLQQPSGTAWDSKLPVDTGGVVSHLLMVHNFSDDWLFKINGALWSVAAEWQIYFVFPLMLMLWQFAGWVVSLLVFGAVSLALAYFGLGILHPQYLLLFLLGAVCAWASFGPQAGASKSGHRTLWILAAGIAAAVIAVATQRFGGARGGMFLLETGIGFGVACLLYYLAEHSRAGRDSLLHRVLRSRPLTGTGEFSYSLYAIHGPILALLNLCVIRYLSLAYHWNFAVMVLLAVPFVVVCARLFYIPFEKRFKNEIKT